MNTNVSTTTSYNSQKYTEKPVSDTSKNPNPKIKEVSEKTITSQKTSFSTTSSEKTLLETSIPVLPVVQPKNQHKESDCKVQKVVVDTKITSQKSTNSDNTTLSLKTQSRSATGSDSDDELPSIQEKIAIFSRTSRPKAQDMTIACKKIIKNVKGSELIEIVHDIIREEYTNLVDLACEYERELDGPMIGSPSEKDGVISIRSQRDWLMTLGGWKGMMPSEEVKDYFGYFSKNAPKFTGVNMFDCALTFPITENRIHITKNFSIGLFNVTRIWKSEYDKWIEIFRTDLSYNQITKTIIHIKNKFDLTDAALAKIQLMAFRNIPIPPEIWNNTPKQNQIEIEQFFHYLNGLMFGIEASGLNAALLIGLMTLDLIAEGEIDFKTAFCANDDGGVYPYATFGDNRNTYKERESILVHNKNNESPLSMKNFRQNPALSPVAVKEMILIKKWLTFKDVTSPEQQYDEQIARIKNAIQEFFNYHFL